MTDHFVPNVACVAIVPNVACERLQPDGAHFVPNVACARDIEYAFSLSLYYYISPLYRARVSHKRHDGLKSPVSAGTGPCFCILRIRDGGRALPHGRFRRRGAP